MTQLMCRCCKQTKDLGEFHVNRRNKARSCRHHYCKDCMKKINHCRYLTPGSEGREAPEPVEAPSTPSYQTLAEILKCSSIAVRSTERRAMAKLKKALTEQGVCSVGDFVDL